MWKIVENEIVRKIVEQKNEEKLLNKKIQSNFWAKKKMKIKGG